MDSFLDEDGEPLVDLDAAAESYRELFPDPQFPIDDDEEDGGDWLRNRSPTPVVDDGRKPRKRLVKKVGKDATTPPVRSGSPVNGLDNWEVEVEESSKNKKRKGSNLMKVRMGKGETSKNEKKKKEKERFSSSRESHSEGYGGGGGDPEMKELWDTIAGADSEGVRTLDDDNFIDDTGVDPADRAGSDNEGYIGNAPQAEEGEEDDEINKLFKGGKKKKKNEKSPAELALIVEHLMAELEVTAEADAELNRQSKPAINKLMKLPMLTDVLAKKQLQQEFLDHGVLTLIKNWLEPLPDGSFPNMTIRTAILKILIDFPIDLERSDRKEQLKKSGLGKVIMFFSKTDEETTANKKLTKELVDKWSRPIFCKSTNFEDMRNMDDERIPYRRPPVKKPVKKATGLESRDDDLDEFSQGPKSGQAAPRQHASRPEAAPLDFLVRPQSKIDPDEIRARAKQQVLDQRRVKMNKKLQQLKAPKKKQLQASKLSVEGRGMVKYL